MSGILKGVGKVFKKVAKVVKKVALPALAIGAVVLTGGAALGVLPALGTTLGSLGLSAGLTATLATAAKAATFGFVGSALMGKNPIKGATTGLLVGGALGAAGMVGGGLGAAQTAGAGALAPGGTLSNTLAGLTDPMTGAATTGGGAAIGGGATAVAGATGSSVPAAAAGLGGGAPAAAGRSLLGGIGSFIERNPMVAGQVISGLGGGLAASADAKERRRAYELEASGYSVDDGALFGLGLSAGRNTGLMTPDERFSPAYYETGVVYDPKTGRVRPRAQVGG